MKYLYILICWVLSLHSYGGEIDPQTAIKVAKNFLKQSIDLPFNPNARITGSREFNLILAYPKIAGSANARKSVPTNTPYYIYNIEERGFIIVANEDAVNPILGYSFESTFDDTHMSPEFEKWMEEYKKQISYVQEHNIKPSREVIQKWQELQDNTKTVHLRTAKTTAVAPLIQTKWNQSPFYNHLCPFDLNSGKYVVAGCVATAMAQILKYHKWPLQGMGFHAYQEDNYGTLSANFGATYYDWDNMPTELNASSSPAEVAAVATLMNHCGVSVDMNYSPKVSGAWVVSSQSPVQHCSEYAFATYFGYDRTTLKGVEKNDYLNNYSQWIQVIKTELEEGRPVLYTGIGGKNGHAFICDGYDNNDFFHMNWGWGGNSDAYFLLDALNPGSLGTGGGDGEYNAHQSALIGIQPPNQNSDQSGELELYSALSVSPSATINYGDSIEVNVNILNAGSSIFQGDYTVGIFNSEGTFLEFVEIKTGYSLDVGYIYTNGLNFKNDGLFQLVPATYYLKLFYRLADREWTAVKEGSYSNLEMLTVKGPANELELYDSISLSQRNIIQNQPFEVTLNVANVGTSDFQGDFSLDLYTYDGNHVAEIEVKENWNLSSNHYYIDGITFSSSGLDVEPGSYLLAFFSKEVEGDWKFVGASSIYPNPVRVIVEAPPILPDAYENNDDESGAYPIPISFVNDQFHTTTPGSNLHIESDVDYYQIELPPGYDYTISARIHDRSNSEDSTTYSCDVVFSISDGTNYTEAYDDVMPANLTVSDGGSFIFKVAPYFAGFTGTYMLDIKLQREQIITGIDVPVADHAKIEIYPNPAQDRIQIKTPKDDIAIKAIQIFNMSGQLRLEVSHLLLNEEIDVSLLLPGLYLIRIDMGDLIETKKIMVQ